MTGCVVIGCDNAAVPMKDILKRSIEEMGIAVEDMGVSSEADQLPYALTAKAVCDRIIDSGYEKRGVLICGTGIGMAVAANKINGIRAVNVINTQFAELCREHNDANIVTLSGRFVDVEENKRILDVFLSTDFGGGRHAGRVEKIMALETPSA